MSENVQIGNVKTFTTHRAVASVSGAGLIQPGVLGTPFTPTSIEVDYVRHDGKAWRVDGVFITDGDRGYRPLGLTGEPGWVREFVEQHMPGSDPR